jgi:hypothetical protein
MLDIGLILGFLCKIFLKKVLAFFGGFVRNLVEKALGGFFGEFVRMSYCVLILFATENTEITERMEPRIDTDFH